MGERKRQRRLRPRPPLSPGSGGNCLVGGRPAGADRSPAGPCQQPGISVAGKIRLTKLVFSRFDSFLRRAAEQPGSQGVRVCGVGRQVIPSVSGALGLRLHSPGASAPACREPGCWADLKVLLPEELRSVAPSCHPCSLPARCVGGRGHVLGSRRARRPNFPRVLSGNQDCKRRTPFLPLPFSGRWL